jgi:hypothetical protein
MPSPERGPVEPVGHPQREEHGPALYQRAARFAGEAPAGEAYFAAQRVLYETPRPTDLSVYRFQLDRLWHVAALGLLPPRPVLHAIEAILDTGQPADLPPAVWRAFQERRVQATRQAPWVERHHRPGERL